MSLLNDNGKNNIFAGMKRKLYVKKQIQIYVRFIFQYIIKDVYNRRLSFLPASYRLHCPCLSKGQH